MVLKMNCGVQTTLGHLLEETTPQKGKGEQNRVVLPRAILRVKIGVYKI